MGQNNLLKCAINERDNAFENYILASFCLEKVAPKITLNKIPLYSERKKKDSIFYTQKT